MWAGKCVDQPDTDQPPSKRDCQAEEEREIHIQLEKKHSDKYSGPKYSLWAEFIRMGNHNDYEQPPAIPLTTGEQKGQPKSSVSEALVRAAMAIKNQTECS